MTQISEHALGLTWVMDEAMQRAAHALVDGDRVWLIDPIDDPAALARVGALGAPQAVVQLLDRHNRDCAAIARRLGVPHLAVGDRLGDAPFTPEPVLRRRVWKEVALWWPAREALVVAEALGTAPTFAVGAGPIGVHPMLRLTPPRGLGRFAPGHLLVGHGPPVHGPATAQDLRRALDDARRDLPKLVLSLPRLLRGQAS
jgi:hypothetical protein